MSDLGEWDESGAGETPVTAVDEWDDAPEPNAGGASDWDAPEVTEPRVSGLGEWDDAEPDVEEGPDDGPSLYYPNVEVFFRDQLAPTYRRELGSPARTWCPQWWRHAEAIARLEALWRAWEHLRLDPATGISVWFRDHADHHMSVLLDADGPFKGCAPGKGHNPRLDALPHDDAPAGMFDV